jgi:uncharacterized membrane protein YhaH (DUF805 family)
MNKTQRGYMKSGFGSSIIWCLLLLILILFKQTREYIPIVIIIFIAMWVITIFNVLMSKDYKKTKANNPDLERR